MTWADLPCLVTVLYHSCRMQRMLAKTPKSSPFSPPVSTAVPSTPPTSASNGPIPSPPPVAKPPRIMIHSFNPLRNDAQHCHSFMPTLVL
jgi:hypothetical protein